MSIQSEKDYLTQMLDELRIAREKYKIPRGFLFVPDRLEISIKRIAYDELHLIYKEYFDYLPETVLDLIIPLTMETLVQIGIPQQQIKRAAKNGVSMELTANTATITSTVLSELLIQKRFNELELESTVGGVRRSTKALTDSSDLSFEWNDEVGKKFFSTLEEVSAITQNNPSLISEMQEIVGKYAQLVEKTRKSIENKNQTEFPK